MKESVDFFMIDFMYIFLKEYVNDVVNESLTEFLKKSLKQSLEKFLEEIQKQSQEEIFEEKNLEPWFCEAIEGRNTWMIFRKKSRRDACKNPCRNFQGSPWNVS